MCSFSEWHRESEIENAIFTNVVAYHPIRVVNVCLKLFLEVNNRGNKLFYGLNGSSAVSANNPTTAADAGDAFLMKQGYTLAWNGWDISAPPGGDRLTTSMGAASMSCHGLRWSTGQVGQTTIQ
jgi:hypothetical protein